MSILRYENIEWALPGLFGTDTNVINAKLRFDSMGKYFWCTCSKMGRWKAPLC